MTYLLPPQGAAPVVVVKDFGGYVDQYEAVTADYRTSGREVRIHECHSACTLALGLPNACVYPNSILKFHQAYDPRTNAVNLEVSRRMFDAYPEAVRRRLGALKREFTVVRGDELIGLGVRQCGTKSPEVITARAAGTKPAGFSLASFTGPVREALLGSPATDDVKSPPPLPPPERRALRFADVVPLPPPRPNFPVPAPLLAAPKGSMRTLIAGAQPILPARFVPYPSPVVAVDRVATR